MSDDLRAAAQAVVDDARGPLDKNDRVSVDPALIVALEAALAQKDRGEQNVMDLDDYMAGLRQGRSDALADALHEAEKVGCDCPPWIEDSPRARHRVHDQGCRTAYITEAIRCLIGEEETDG